MWNTFKAKRFFSILLMFAALCSLFGSCTKSLCIEKRKKNCVCPMVFDPVCGCNGLTYGNSCEAECAGIQEYTSGECK